MTGMTREEEQMNKVYVRVWPVEAYTIVECSICGPVGVSEDAPRYAAARHMVDTHSISQIEMA